MKKKAIVFSALLSFYGACFGILVDTSGNAATSTTKLGDIDMGQSTAGDMGSFVATSSMSTNVIKDVVTNTTIVGYSAWSYSGSTTSGASYNITTEPSGGSYVFTLWNTTTATQLGNVTTNELNPTKLVFAVSGGSITSSRNALVRNTNGLALYSDIQQLEEKIDSMDTSYLRTVGITNTNQSVQYVYAAAGVTSLEIQMPANGMTKDWLVYVLSTEDVSLVLPPANYWVVSETATNAIPASTPTALYFSQINDDTYSIGRQELIPITVATPLSIMMKSVYDKMKKKKQFAR